MVKTEADRFEKLADFFIKISEQKGGNFLQVKVPAPMPCPDVPPQGSLPSVCRAWVKEDSGW